MPELPAPHDGIALTHFIVSDDVERVRVADIQAIYDEWSAPGATFLTPPIDRGSEIRCYLRDPDSHLIEVGQTTGLADRR